MNLYVHLPFCKSKCQYCDFNSYADCDDALIFSYLGALNKEIKLAGAQFKNAVIRNVYIGGGTPSVLPAERIAFIADNLRKNFNIDINEFSIECNPESVDEQKLEKYAECGINRISFGVQSLSDDNLKSIGRIHNAATALKKLETAGKYFKNVSADMIIGLPYDTVELVKDEIRAAARYVEHLSIYELSVEDGTPLKKRVENGSIWLPDDDEIRDLFDAAADEARSLGFERYEISNFAKNGNISAHNFAYWTRDEYLGIGAGAHSFVKTSDGSKPLDNELRFSSPKNPNAYIGGINCVSAFNDVPRAEWDVLDKSDAEKEAIMLGLRTVNGVDAGLLEGKIPENLKSYFIRHGANYSLTDDGMAVMNSILIQLI